MSEKVEKKKLQTPPMRASYPHLFKAVAGPDGGEPKFSITLVTITPEDNAKLAELKAEALRVGIARFGQRFEEGVRAGKYKWPFRTSDNVDVGKGYGVGNVFFAARTDEKFPPGVVSRFKGPDNKPTQITEEMQKLGNPGEIYPGCIVRASLVAYAYDNVSKGVTFALNNVQKLGEGKRLDTRVAASDEFEADLTEEPASMEEIVGAEIEAGEKKDQVKSLLS